MARYHRETAINISGREKLPSSGDGRRGVIPQVESPQQKMLRLQNRGYYQPSPSKNEFIESEFSKFDLGNKDLPAYKHKKEIIDAINNNRIILLTGPTGSGKTTQVGQFALEAGYDRVVYLLPRRVNVDNNAERIEVELAESIGEDRAREIVGLAHGERATRHDGTKINLLTSGTFTRMVDQLAEDWKADRVLIVADETHENNLETEFASAFAVRQLESHDDWRVVFASATPDQNAITDSYESINGGEIPVISIEGRPHNLDMKIEPNLDTVSAYHEHSAGVQKAMIFVDGKRSIDETIKELRRTESNHEKGLTRYFKLHARISDRAKQEIFNMDLGPGEKAVIVSTSAGQSGITIPGLSLVIGSGITKSPELDEEGAPGLPARLCTQAEITQQAGRAGRDVEGGVFVLTRPLGADRTRNRNKDLFRFVPLEKRDKDMPPEIYHSNISRNVLAATVLGENFFEFNDYLKNSVKQSSIVDAYDLLYNLGAVDEYNKVTDIGKAMDVYPLRPELSRAAVEVSQNHSLPVQVYTLVIASAIEAGGLVDYVNRNSDWKKHLRDTTEDDFIAQLDLMMASREHFYGGSVNEREVEGMGLDVKAVYQAHRQFDKMCRLIGLEPRDIELPPPRTDEEEELKEIFLMGMPDLVYKLVSTQRRKYEYKNALGYDQAITREISSRSLLSSIGRRALQIVVGYPRWYIDGDDQKQDVIEFAYPVEPSKLLLLDNMVKKDATPSIRGGNLVHTGHQSYGSIILNDLKIREQPAKTQREKELLVEEFLISSSMAKSMIDMGEKEEKIRSKALDVVDGVYSIGMLEGKLWGYFAQVQNSKVE